MDSTLALFPELVDLEPGARTTGVLPSQRLEEIIAAGYIRSAVPIQPEQIQPSSLDLRLGSVAYRIRASFLPNSNSTVERRLQGLALERLDLTTPALLRTNEVYLVPLMEELNLPTGLSGKANPKSSIGRIDLFVRLICDYGTSFEEVTDGYKGRLYAEIAPLTFSVLVSEGQRLNQLRIRRGNPLSHDGTLEQLHQREPLVYSQGAQPVEGAISRGLKVSVDLAGLNGSDVVGYIAQPSTTPIDLARIGFYDSELFWRPIRRQNDLSLVLEPGAFYILTSKEKVTVPPNQAAEMLPYDPSVGEFRVHYAGFFDPGFGWGKERSLGSHAVLEVRAHGVTSLLEDGQVVARLQYEPLMASPSRLYGQNIGSSYQSQTLTLSKFFKRH